MTDVPDLQFDRAHFDGDAAQPGCTMCRAPLYGVYYGVNGQTVCEACCYKLRDAVPPGSRAGRVLRAAAAGAGAGLAGAILYWAILAATGYEFGLIAILVGFAVGKAVRWGSGDRGGRAYQALAVLLTYVAIVSGYVPLIVTEAIKQSNAQHQTASPDGKPSAPGSVPASTTAAPDGGGGPPGGIGGLLLAIAALLLIACAAPFLAGAQNIMGIIIIGIGVYQAWKLNRRLPVEITGPHSLASAGAAPAGT